MVTAQKPLMQYRIPAVVDRVFEHSDCTGGSKDADGRPVLTYGPPRWFVHFAGSSESLCFGPEKPEFTVGEVVDIIIRKRR